MSSTSMGSQTARIGFQARQTPTRVLATLALAVMNSISGKPNSQDWIPSETDANAGFGHFGSCCYELDIWEANEISTVFTPHPCETVGQERCEGTPCGDNKSG